MVVFGVLVRLEELNAVGMVNIPENVDFRLDHNDILILNLASGH